MRHLFRTLFTSILLSFILSSVSYATLIAQNDGSENFNTADYTNGFGTSGVGNFIDKSVIDSLNPLIDSVIIKLTMGENIDYYKPTAGNDLIGMLTSNLKHLWAPDLNTIFVQPVYYPNHLGGSQVNWSGLSDGRKYLSFWGTTALNGGCCHLTTTDSSAWSRAFTLETVSSVPEPTTLVLFGLGLCGLGFSRRKKI
ncbi:MAG: hypothetical protein ACJA2G_003571 [Cognaticolwellia sp.]|jgi:hypothetical protein